MCLKFKLKVNVESQTGNTIKSESSRNLFIHEFWHEEKASGKGLMKIFIYFSPTKDFKMKASYLYQTEGI